MRGHPLCTDCGEAESSAGPIEETGSDSSVRIGETAKAIGEEDQRPISHKSPNREARRHPNNNVIAETQK